MSSLWQVNFRFHISMCSTNGIAHYEIICWHMDSYCIILVIYTRINYTAQHQTYPNIETILYIMKPYVDMWNYTMQYKSYVDIWNHSSQYIQYADIWNNIEVNEAICQNMKSSCATPTRIQAKNIRDYILHCETTCRHMKPFCTI